MDDSMRERLIEEIREHPNIWNTKLRSFKDSRAKANSWSEIAENLDLSGVVLISVCR